MQKICQCATLDLQSMDPPKMREPLSGNNPSESRSRPAAPAQPRLCFLARHNVSLTHTFFELGGRRPHIGLVHVAVVS